MTAVVTPQPPVADTGTLVGAVRLFVGYPTPWLVGGGLFAALVARFVVAPLGALDLVVVVVLVALQPLTEWVIHVTVLHARPVRVLGRSVDLFAAAEHRRHHAHPRDLRGSLVPLRVLGEASVLIVLLSLPWPGAAKLTAIATQAGLGLVYEWIHFLIHSDYKPRHAPYRRLYQAHRLHHYKNERYWFGVTRTLGDRLLGTSPAKDSVPTSPTCRDLLGAQN